MTAIGILTTWLTLTAAGFAGLSALGRAGAREGGETDLTLMECWPISDRSLVLDDARNPIPDPEGSAVMSPMSLIGPILLAGAGSRRRLRG